ncbi:MAG: DUF72 domain-containing protein [Methanothrix sp.]|nr:DUF72 domain-containing protein [Methanothrix sp.]
MKGFEYSVKVPQLVTHKALVEGDPKKAIFWATSFEKTCVEPLAEAGLLDGVLLQLSPYFKNEGSALATLKGVLDAVSCPEIAVPAQQQPYYGSFESPGALAASRGRRREQQEDGWRGRPARRTRAVRSL